MNLQVNLEYFPIESQVPSVLHLLVPFKRIGDILGISITFQM